jgi:glutamate 5-kinase
MRKRWVIKAGSNIIVRGGPLLLRSWMQQVASLLKHHDTEVIWVTSGAIATAVERTQLQRTRKLLSEKQALSAIGQPLMMDLYNLALGAVGLLGAQVLLTYDDLKHRERRRNFQNTLEKLLSWGATPILNENDAIATEEIQFGDNDSLSAKVAIALNADRLVILTDVDGLFDKDPRLHPDARLLHELHGVARQLLAQTEKTAGSGRGTGGMYSKLMASREANRAGIETWLARGDHPSVLLEIAANQSTGTRILPKEPRRDRRR